MTRYLLSAGLLALVAGFGLADPPAVTSPPPRITLARVAEGALILEEVVTFQQVVTETRTVTENGVTKNVAVAVPVQVQKIQARSVPLKEVKAFDLDGRTVTPGRLAYMLKERTAVAISGGGNKLDPAFRKILKDDALLLLVPLEEPVP
jgi:hypothetical protein